MTTTKVFIGVGTTGLNLEQDTLWELSLIIEDHVKPEYDGEWGFQFAVNVNSVSPTTLDTLHFKETYTLSDQPVGAIVITKFPGNEAPKYRQPYLFIRELLQNSSLIGDNVSRDVHYLLKVIRYAPWSASVEVKDLAAGYLVGSEGTFPAMPYTIEYLSSSLGVVPPETVDQYSATYYAKWVRDLFNKVTNPAQYALDHSPKIQETIAKAKVTTPVPYKPRARKAD